MKKFTWDNLVLRFKIETQSALGTFKLNLLLFVGYCFDLLESSFFFSSWTHIEEEKSWIETNKICIRSHLHASKPHGMAHTHTFIVVCVLFYICANLHRNCFVWYPTAYSLLLPLSRYFFKICKFNALGWDCFVYYRFTILYHFNI